MDIYASSLPTTGCRCGPSGSPLLSLTSGRVFVVYNMDDEIDVDIEGDEFQSTVRLETCQNRRI